LRQAAGKAKQVIGMGRRVKVVERPLRRHRAVGLADKDRLVIDIDPRQSPKGYFGTAIHELLHLAYPEMNEAQVRQGEKLLRETLWQMRFRRVAQ
jgi:hypothetical protein